MPRFDIHIQALPQADQEQTFKFMSFGFESALGVKGFQMLINQWLKCLLTAKGSDPTDLRYGTDITAMVGSNLPIGDARDLVAIAIETCNEQTVANQRGDISLTLSERLASASLIAFTEDRTSPGFSASIEIKNQAGERLQFSLPMFSGG